MDKLRGSSISSQGYGNVYKKVLKDKRLSKIAKLIHCYFCSYAGAGDTAFPAVSITCYDLDLNEDTYYEHMLYLKAYGYITVEPNRDAKGKFKNNIYTIEQYPEQYEDEEYKKKIEEIINKRKKKNEKARKKKENNPYTDNPDTDKPGTDNPSADKPGTNNNNLKTNNNKNIISYLSIWEMAAELLKKHVSEPIYNEFISVLKPFSYEDNTFTILCPDDFSKTIIELRHMDKMHMVMGEVCKLHNINEFQILIKV